MRRLLPALLACCLLPAVHAEDRAATERQLEEARREIAELQKQLGSLSQEKAGVLKRLKATEGEMGDLQKQINSLEQQLKDSEREIQRLDDDKKKLQSQRDEQRKLIAIQARAAYQGGQQESLKLMLNQEQPEQLTRVLTYHDYMARARSEQIASYQATLERLGQIEDELTDRHAMIAGQRFELQGRKDELNGKLAQHRHLIASLTQEMGTGEQRLKRMQREQAELNQALQELDQRLAREREREQQASQPEPAREVTLASRKEADEPARSESRQEVARQDSPRQEPARQEQARQEPARQEEPASVPDTSNLSFRQARGKLPLPVSGAVLARFGSPREGDIKWEGMLIGADAGTRVRAIHGGRVVFAEHMSSLGQLLIIDHGSGFMSLYGFNQRLLKSRNDQVKAGDVIATVGNSGGQAVPSLYFSIRQNGQPVDPQVWCRNQG